jgi:hypothetical protein
MNRITSQVAGELTQDEQLDDWWESTAAIAVPFFDGRALPVVFMNYTPAEDAAFLQQADDALRNFLALTMADRLAVSAHVHKNCTDFLEVVGHDEADEPMHAIKDASEIWAFVHPTNVYVKRRHRRDRDVYVQIACECEWEGEHGLQLVFRRGRQLTRVSAQDGHMTEADAQNKPDEEDELLSRFKA